MKTFEDSLKRWFYENNSNALENGARVCLLDASGNPIGSDTIERVASFMNTKDELVDMGLPSGVLWSKRNLGALTVNDYGWYFSWGNLEAHQQGAGYDFSQATYDTTPAKDITTNLTLAQDAARANLGGAWRMPTTNEFAELFNSSYTTNEWVTNYNGVSGLNGRLVTSKKNNNTLFFPAAGGYNGTSLNYRGSNGFYWSSSFYSSTNARNLNFNSSNVNPQNNNERRYGFSVRPVQPLLRQHDCN